MNLAVSPPLLPMLAKRVESIPEGAHWIFEPKWDGFRVLVFKDGDEVLIQSRDEKSLNRYFPELLPPLVAQLPARCMLDGEVVISRQGALDFDALQLRIHPAASRVKMLAASTPASVVFFDLLCEGDTDMREQPFQQRRARLEAILKDSSPPLYLTPATHDTEMARDWFQRFEGAGFDGVVAKRIDGIYEPDKRVMLKIKHQRDCDCVVAGFRWYKKGEQDAIGSLLLGLYDEHRNLQHVGVCGSFPLAKRKEMVEFLAAYRENAATGHPWASGPGEPERVPGAKSRWSRDKDLSWEPLRPELVAEVAYEHMQGNRFRHMAQFRRWRFDKPPSDCTYAQLETVAPQELASIFGDSGV